MKTPAATKVTTSARIKRNFKALLPGIAIKVTAFYAFLMLAHLLFSVGGAK